MGIIKKILTSVILSGVIILLIGFYYTAVKAGIPYQDPTPEMQYQYVINMRVGDSLLLMGAAMIVGGGILRLIAGLIGRKKQS
ncbi:MAG: hypothetical protein IK115_12335 [Lachnospiraceae bacterium]|nr:hypothetical protein [Lachnospiraceae bacterium]